VLLSFGTVLSDQSPGVFQSPVFPVQLAVGILFSGCRG
jgi:hypothetical protein